MKMLKQALHRAADKPILQAGIFRLDGILVGDGECARSRCLSGSGGRMSICAQPAGVISMRLPWPPSVNHYWGQRGGRKYITERGVKFRMAVAEAVAERGVRIEGRLSVVVALHQPTRAKCDIDNYLKALLDAMQHAGLYDDDAQIDHLTVIRFPPKKGGECKVVISRA